MTQTDLEKLYEDFNLKFPLESLKSMTLEQYTNLDKNNSFCYWLEAVTSKLGSIWGGTSYKFGVYKRRQNSKKDNRVGYGTDGDYAWVKKYGNSAEEAFEKVKRIVIEICNAARDGRFEDIDKLDLGGTYKWKIAYLYSNEKLIAVFRPENLKAAAKMKGLEVTNKTAISQIHRFLMSKKPNSKSIIEYSQELWEESLRGHIRKYWLYAPGEKAGRWEQFYNEEIMALGWDELGDLNQFKTKKDTEDAINIAYGNEPDKRKNNDSAANYDFCHIMQIGDVIFAKDGMSKIIGYGIVMSLYYYDDTAEDFLHRREVDWKEKGNWDINHHIVKTLTDITDSEISSDIRDVFKLNDNAKPKDVNVELDIPLNSILCGPPGTGKTYKLQKHYAEMFTDEEHLLPREKYVASIIKDLTWWEVIALVLYETDKVKIKEICNNRNIKIKASFSNNNTISQTISRTLQEHAKDDHSNVRSKQEPLVCEKDENYYWSADKKMLKESMPEIIELIDKINNYVSMPRVYRRYEFITFHQKYSYEDFIVGITPVLNKEEGDDCGSALKFEKRYGIFYDCCEEAIRLAGFTSFEDCYEKSKKERDEMFFNATPYAIFIDEINRANISAVFGELITCVEDDKRLGADNELWVKLPVNGGMFGVPNNLYIIGTMNTADRSIALIDVALRRRFEFNRMLTDYDVIPEWAKDILRALNEEIFKQKKSTDFFIGHSFFMNNNESDLNKIFDNKIIPLLYEYFQNNTERVKEVLGSANVEVKEDNHILKFVKIK